MKKIEDAIHVLSEAIKSDGAYRHAWKSNIAVAFQDEMSRRGIGGDLVYRASNVAADYFLDLLISKSVKIRSGE